MLICVCLLAACANAANPSAIRSTEATSPLTAATTAGTTATTTAETTAKTTTAETTTTTAETTTTTAKTTTTEIGRSVEGRPITLVERGPADGTPVLVIGVIHGDEAAGVQIARSLTTETLAPGVHLYVVESMNPDGQAAGTRANARGVDLNRNFPANWAPLGRRGDSQYAGTAASSEPETAAIVELITAIRPKLAIWYHQDLNRIDADPGPSGNLARRYASLTGLPLGPVTGGIYTGTATPWEESVVPDSTTILVELGSTLSADQVVRHTAAVLAVASGP